MHCLLCCKLSKVLEVPLGTIYVEASDLLV